jgi:hypothetical protein
MMARRWADCLLPAVEFKKEYEPLLETIEAEMEGDTKQPRPRSYRGRVPPVPTGKTP